MCLSLGYTKETKMSWKGRRAVRGCRVRLTAAHLVRRELFGVTGESQGDCCARVLMMRYQLRLWQRKLWYWCFFFVRPELAVMPFIVWPHMKSGAGGDRSSQLLHKCTFEAWREQKHSRALAHCLCSLAALRSPEWLSFGFFNYTAFILSPLRL